MAEPLPLHLLAASADRRTQCGLDIRQAAAHPYVLACHLAQHQTGRGPLTLCPTCQSLTEEGIPTTPTQ
jgi:hypothetical protein